MCFRKRGTKPAERTVDVSAFPMNDGGMEPERLQRLGLYVVERRRQRGWPTRQAFADNVDLTYRVLTDIENGVRALGPKANATIERALLWQPGSIDTILAGGKPTPLPEAEGAPATWPRDAGGSAESYDVIFGRAAQRNRESLVFSLAEVAHLTGISPERLRAIESGTARSLEPAEVVSIALALQWDTYEALTLAGYNGYGQGAVETQEPAVSPQPTPDSSIAVGLIDTMHELFKEFISADRETMDRIDAEFLDLAAEAALLQRLAPGLSSTTAGMMAVLGQERDLVNRARNLLAQFTRPTPESSQQATADELEPQQDPLGQKLSGRDEHRDSGHH
ncbi:immunity repressor [Mycobacterium phage prophiGD05-3]|nr:immunity repressor [Mycobacterium phage prophiGD05-3]